MFKWRLEPAFEQKKQISGMCESGSAKFVSYYVERKMGEHH